jgi:hypothetical protein
MRTFCCLVLFTMSAVWAQDSLPLAGEWRFKLDPAGEGLAREWFRETLPDRVSLPGSLNENGIGDAITAETEWTGTLNSRMWHDDARFAAYRDPDNTKILFWLQPDRRYVGAAWYQREIEIPEHFDGQHVEIVFQRCHWETRLWVDGQSLGSQNSLSTPHIYDASAYLRPGIHTITLRVDNSYAIDVGLNAHSVSDNTQTNWNGVIGKMAVRALPKVRIVDLQVYPDVQARCVDLRFRAENGTGHAVAGNLTIVAHSDGHRAAPYSIPVNLPEGESPLTLRYALGDDAQCWNEFNPVVYTLQATLETADGGRNDSHPYETCFGLRELGMDGTQFTLNGECIFLRGTLECAIFPLSGYPPSDVASWIKILTAAKAHGLNHLRFHSWCPPEAAFIAGDRMGFLYQIEGPFWTHPGEGDPLDSYIIEECDRILKAYGNHPSFGFFAYGNEPGGRKHEAFLGNLVEDWKAKDPRRLYTAAAGWPMIDANQFHVAHQPRVHSNYGGKGMRFSVEPFASIMDYREYVAKWPVPIVSHEIGQWCVFPNLEEIPKYTGPLKPRNFEIVRDLLEAQGMLDQAHDFFMASGKLQVICYKEEIEAALRTPGFGGFQLLDLHDFPGQGTALVGMIDPFWESKDYVTPEAFHRFCSPTVPLVRMPSCVFTQDERFNGQAEVTHFGPAPLQGVSPAWHVKDVLGNVLLSGVLPARDIPRGSAIALGEIDFSFAGLQAPAQLLLELSVGPFSNGWDLWVYPETASVTLPVDINVADMLDDAAIEALDAGKTVLLTPKRGAVTPPRFGQVPPGFPPIFWNTFWFPAQQLRTLGLLCNPEHPLFAAFPTAFHSNWQWWDLVTRAQVMSLDGLPPSLRPLVQIIDDWNTCRRLGYVFEAQVGRGKLLACSMDIENELDSRPAARQFRASLLAYIGSDAFAPEQALTIEELRSVFCEPSPMIALGARASADSAESGYEAHRAIDGDPSTFWHTRWTNDIKPYPHWIRIDLEEAADIAGIVVLPRQDMINGRIGKYAVFVGEDLSKMGRAIAKGEFPAGAGETTIRFDSRQHGKHILLRAERPQHPDHPWATVAEIRLLTNIAEQE